ncbi:hypothetical protein [Oharaeibacter diazotrophicus]|uniref:Uncharacterized protein n=1 Tax=Oharaeibacter diazotrophicus TaxID=1920512 RepID=A0A4R6RJQ6_9HYPH|nr:hypothetical protein [Oharaeibacter diazotrophicus]TDP86710.1 hypothetical protein EDD54_0590 [Oharaeibacter diazotrophicus]BBE71348.1 hypothetical protein OHA_1_00921 [Pleomorphomonas sp. SM30]GLS78103.1 hypothetical protein GCM10007904_34400 [Oharaeibacter diazotrophicus]
MKSIVLAAAMVLATAPFAAADSPAPAIPGSFDPIQRIFVPAQPQTAPAAAPVSVAGQVSYSFAITVASTIPTSTPIECAVQLTHIGATGGVYFESASTTATRSGTKANCTVKVPYLWAQANNQGFVQPQITLFAGEKRQLVHTLAPFLLPGNNQTRSFSQTLRF